MYFSAKDVLLREGLAKPPFYLTEASVTQAVTERLPYPPLGLESGEYKETKDITSPYKKGLFFIR
jgi:hypothetical protein